MLQTSDYTVRPIQLQTLISDHQLLPLKERLGYDEFYDLLLKAEL